MTIYFTVWMMVAALLAPFVLFGLFYLWLYGAERGWWSIK